MAEIFDSKGSIMCRTLAAATLLVGIAAFLPAQEPASSKSIAQLIDQLGNQDFKVREAAAKAIEDLGPEALPALRKVKDHPDAEVRRRIKEWIPRFEMEAFVAPKRVNLDAKDVPLETVVAEVARQTGYQLELSTKDARTKKRVRLRFAKTTFWEALDKVCQEGGLELSAGRESPEKMMLDFEGATYPYRNYRGAFRIRASGFHYHRQTYVTRGIEFAQLPRNAAAEDPKKERTDVSESFRFDFDLVAEPRLTILYLGEPNLTLALDDQNRSMLPKKEENDDRFFHSSRMRRHPFMGREQSASANLLVPAKSARTMKVLRGTVPVYLEKERKRTVLVDNLSKAHGKKHKSAGFTVEIDLLKQRAGDQYFLYFSFSKDKPGGRGRLDNNDGSFELEDAEGHRYEAHGYGMSGNGTTTEAHINFGPSRNNPGPLGPPVRLVYVRSIPLEYQVPFEFKDLPLP